MTPYELLIQNNFHKRADKIRGKLLGPTAYYRVIWNGKETFFIRPKYWRPGIGKDVAWAHKIHAVISTKQAEFRANPDSNLNRHYFKYFGLRCFPHKNRYVGYEWFYNNQHITSGSGAIIRDGKLLAQTPPKKRHTNEEAEKAFLKKVNAIITQYRVREKLGVISKKNGLRYWAPQGNVNLCWFHDPRSNRASYKWIMKSDPEHLDSLEKLTHLSGNTLKNMLRYKPRREALLIAGGVVKYE